MPAVQGYNPAPVVGAMSGSSSDRVLTHSHHRSYVSQSGLANVLKEIREHGLPKATSRRAIKRSRELALPADLMVYYQLEMEDGSVTTWPAINPAVLLQHMCSQTPFAELLGSVIDLREPGAKFTITIYSDEVLPGNPLKPDNGRKLVAFYWSLQEFGDRLGMEDLWFHLGSLRRVHVVEAKGGWSQVFCKLANVFFTSPYDMSRGIVLNLGSSLGQRLLVANIGCIVGDAPALQFCWGWKGATGVKCCLFCSNVCLHSYELADHDRSGQLVSQCELDETKYALQTDRSVRDSVDLLARSFGTIGRGRFDNMEKALGFNYLPEGALFNNDLMQHLDGGPISITQYDFMHIYYVGGIWNTECGYLLERLKKAGIISYREVHDALQPWMFPKHFKSRGITGQGVFKKHSDGEAKCSASEGLSIYPLIRFILMELNSDPNKTVLMAHPDVTAAVHSYFALCVVLDRLKNLSIHSADEVSTCIKTHLNLRLRAYGHACFQPKCHFSMHIPQFMRRSKKVLSCWVHERKHRELKRYGTATCMSNMTSSYEKGLLQECVLAQCQRMETLHLRGPIELVSPAEASDIVSQHVNAWLNSEGLQVQVADEVCVNGALFIHRQDVALVCVDGAEQICEVWIHVYVPLRNLHLSCCSIWQPLGNNRFQIVEQPMFLQTHQFLRCCVHKKEGNVASVVP